MKLYDSIAGVLRRKGSEVWSVSPDSPGVISTGDLVQWIISAHEVMVEQLNNYITGRYPA